MYQGMILHAEASHGMTLHPSAEDMFRAIGRALAPVLKWAWDSGLFYHWRVNIGSFKGV